MYGLVIISLQEMITKNYGPEKWNAVKRAAGVDEEILSRLTSYDDSVTYQLVGAAANELNITADELLERFGNHWITITAIQDYGELICAAGANIRDFLLHLPQFHTRVVLFLPNLQPPQFYCSDVGENTLTLHYSSTRAGLAPFVLGAIRGVGELYNKSVEVKQVDAKAQDGKYHHSFHVSWS